MSACEIKAATSAPITVRQVQQIISALPHLEYKKRLHSPKLMQTHKDKQVTFARYFLNNPVIWMNVIYSDKKQFNLDGPDRLHYYWHNLQKEEKIYSTCQKGGASVMVWGAFCAHNKNALRFIEKTMNSLLYLQVLEAALLPFIADKLPCTAVFQHDNASVHTSRISMAWFREQHITLLEWPPLLPDLNPIENIWGILARKVYNNGQKQFDNLADLRAAIQAS